MSEFISPTESTPPPAPRSRTQNAPGKDGKYVAKNLAANKDRILKEWCRRAREQLPSSNSLQESDLVNSLPIFIDHLVEVLADDAPSEALKKYQETLAKEHGEERAQFREFSLEQTIFEYNIFREVVFEVLEEEDDVSKESRNVILDAIQTATRNSASQFVAVRTAERDVYEQALKRSRDDLEKNVEQRTREFLKSEERFKRLVEGVKDYAIFTVDPHGYITSWNKGAQRVKEYTAEEAVGRHFSMLYPEEAKLRNEPCEHLKSAEIEGRFRGEGMRVKKSGDFFLADVLITPMYEDGVLYGFSKVVADLTERNQLIQERDLTRTDLEEMKLERTDRERFVATLTHDLRNPLTAAKAGAQMILRYPERREQHPALAGRIVDNLNRADRMISDLLDANRIHAGESLPIRMEPCNLNQIAVEVVEDLSTIHGARFKISTDAQIDGFWGCESIRRILENLLTNAVKYGDEAEIISLKLEQKDSRRVHIRVHNKGPAISVADQKLLFDPFRRAKSAERGIKKGWGLGLTLVRGLTEAHGGIVMVQSYPIEGTTFVIDLPLDSRHAQKAEEGGEMRDLGKDTHRKETN